MRSDNQFTYGEWVVPISTEKSKQLNSGGYQRELDSHIGHAVKVKQCAYMYGPAAGAVVWKYLCSNLWYAESDLVAKEDFKSLKVIGKSADIAASLEDLL